MGNNRMLSALFVCFSLLWILPGFIAAQHGSTRASRSYACEGQVLNINCNLNPGDTSQRIRVVRANYGRYSVAVCNPLGISSWSVKCTSHTSLQVLNERCNDKPSCSVEVDDRTFGDDPCPETEKYLEVHYECTSDGAPAEYVSRTREIAVTTPTTAATTTSSTTSTSTTSTTTSTTTTPDPTLQELTTQFLRLKTRKPPTPSPVMQVDEAIDPVDPLPQQATEYCESITRGNITWERTAKGATAYQLCRADPKVYVEWTCGRSSPPQWDGSPDFSRCTSSWMEDMRRKLVAANSNPELLAEEFAQLTANNRMTSGGDLSSAIDMIDVMVKRGYGAAARMSVGDQGPNTSIQKLGLQVLKTGSNILANQQNSSWADLAKDVQTQKATQLIDLMESTAFMVADNVERGTILNGAEENILMQAAKLTAQKTVPFALGQSKVTFTPEILRPFLEDDVVKVIFLSYNNLGDYLSQVGNDGQYAPVDGYVVNSRVVSAAINGRRSKVELAEPVVIEFEHLFPKGNRNAVCAYWDYEGGKAGQEFKASWSTKGCWVVDSRDDDRTVCACSHLTNFAVLMDTTGTIASSQHDVPLTTITYIGCSISIVCLIVTLIVFFSFRSLQSERTTIHKNLVFCLLIAEIFFLAGINQTHLPVGCNIFSAIMHYFFLATFAWSLFEGINIWLLLVEVFESGKSRRVWYYLGGYVGPLIIVAVCLGIDWKSYATEKYCWLRSDNYFILGFVVPVGIVVVANIVFLAVAMYYMCRNAGLQSALHARDADTWRNLKKWISGALGLVFVMSITWIFGFMYLGNTETIIFAYVFTFLNSFQGLFIFVLICLRNDKVKIALRQFINHQGERLTGSFCGRSTGTEFSDAGTHGGRQGFYQCAPPLDKEQQYIASFAPCWYGTRPADCTSRRNTTTSTLPPHSPAPVPQCTCEHDVPEKSSTRSSNRDSGHESVSCPSAESPPMQPIHIHQRTLYPPSAARKHASQVLKSEYPATAARIAARNVRYIYGERAACCDEHIYAEIEQQQLEEEVCPYSESDESNTSVYQINGSEASNDDDQLPKMPDEMEGRKILVTCHAEHRPLITSLSRTPGDFSCRPVDVRSAFRSLAHTPHAHQKLRNNATTALRKPHVCRGAVGGDSYPYVNTAPRMPNGHQFEAAVCPAGSYNAFGLMAASDGSQMIRRMPVTNSLPPYSQQQVTPFSEC